MKQLLHTIKSAFVVGTFFTLFVLSVILLFNPRFVDSFPPLLIVYVIVIAFITIISHIAYLIFGRFFRNYSSKTKMSYAFTISSVLFLSAIIASIFFIPDSVIFILSVVILAIFFYLVFPAIHAKNDNLLIKLKIPVLAIICLLFILAVFNIYNNKKPAQVSLIMFCLDGATWKIIDPLLKEGQLPTFSELCREGSYGILKSSNPMLSPIVWTTIATGKSSRKHGITNFFDTARSIKTSRLWDIIEQNGANIGIFAYPLTWPPREVPDGFMFPSHFARGNQTYPPNLSFLKDIGTLRKSEFILSGNEILKFTAQGISQGVCISTLYESFLFLLNGIRGKIDPDEKEFLDRMMKMYWYRDVYIHILKEYNPEFTIFFLNQPDAISHLYWKYYEPEGFPGLNGERIDSFRDIIPETYKEIDRVMGNILQELPSNVKTVVISDHGFKSIQEPGSDISYRINTQRLIEDLELTEEITGVNISNTTILQCEKVGSDRFNEIIKLIEDITLVEIGEKAFDVWADSLQNIFVTVSGYSGSRENFHLNLLDKSTPYLEIVEEKETYDYSGVHDLDGILIIKGEGIKKNNHFQKRAKIYDITPTVLAYLDIPVGNDMIGKVLTHLFEADSLLPISYIKTHDSSFDTTFVETIKSKHLQNIPPDLQKRLRALGYIN